MNKIISVLLAVFTVLSVFSFTVSAEERFIDVKTDDWFYRAVEYCFNNKLMIGVSDTSFDPTATVSREMFVMTLANMEGIDPAEYDDTELSFVDVRDDTWYSAAIKWAKSKGLVEGMSNNYFGIGYAVTREQAAKMLCSYAAYKGIDVEADTDLSRFTDADDISHWAIEGFKYTVSKGIFKGNDKSELNPQGETTRAELSSLLKATVAYENNNLVCWGDSLTQGIIEGFHDIAEYPYPRRTAEHLDVPYYNFGIGGDTAEAIAIRQGGIAIYVDDVTIPADKTAVSIDIVAEEGYTTKNINENGDKGLNPVTIGGIEGTITGDYEVGYQFTRSTAGEEKVISEPVRIVTSGMNFDYSKSILVICSGANNTKEQAWHDDPVAHMQYLCKIQQKMVDYAGTDNFVIIGLPKVRFMQKIPNYNYILEEYWGEHYLDVNTYMMSEKAITDNGLTVRGFDRKDIKEGYIPRSLLDPLQQLHPSQIGYDIISRMLADKIYDLNYLK